MNSELRVESIWHGQLGLPFRIATWGRGGLRTRVVVVHVEGNYWVGGVEGGGFLQMIVAAALENPRGRGIGLLCDLSGLAYQGGDRLFMWRGVAALRDAPGYQVGLVSSTENRAPIQSLLEADDEEDLKRHHFQSVEEGIAQFLERAT